jgi:hypothetical protein
MKALDRFYCAYSTGTTSYWFLHNSDRAPRGPDLRLVQSNGAIKIARRNNRPKTIKDLWLNEPQVFPSLELAAQYALVFFVDVSTLESKGKGSHNNQSLVGTNFEFKI